MSGMAPVRRCDCAGSASDFTSSSRGLYPYVTRCGASSQYTVLCCSRLSDLCGTVERDPIRQANMILKALCRQELPRRQRSARR
jgi:hypothetical protein